MEPFTPHPILLKRCGVKKDKARPRLDKWEAKELGMRGKHASVRATTADEIAGLVGVAIPGASPHTQTPWNAHACEGPELGALGPLRPSLLAALIRGQAVHDPDVAAARSAAARELASVRWHAPPPLPPQPLARPSSPPPPTSAEPLLQASAAPPQPRTPQPSDLSSHGTGVGSGSGSSAGSCSPSSRRDRHRRRHRRHGASSSRRRSSNHSSRRTHSRRRHRH